LILSFTALATNTEKTRSPIFTVISLEKSHEIPEMYAFTDKPGFYNSIYVNNSGTCLRSTNKFSEDNGKSWILYPVKPDFLAELPHGYRRTPVTAILDPNTGWIVSFINSLDTPGLDPKVHEPTNVYHMHYIRYRTSVDSGESWLVDEPIIKEGTFAVQNSSNNDFNSANPIYLGDKGSAPIITKSGKILIGAQLPMIGTDGKVISPGIFEVLVLIGTWIKNHRLSWKISERIIGDKKWTTRGLCEPTLVQLDNGSIMMVMRASNGHKQDPDYLIPSYKWYAISKDDGLSWSEPKPLKFDNGENFFSPASMSTFFKHSTGRIFWVGNISEENCRANSPRWPLVIGELDINDFSIIHSSLFIVDTYNNKDQTLNRKLDISHFTIIEDRVTNNIILTYPRCYNNYKSTEWCIVRLSVD